MKRALSFGLGLVLGFLLAGLGLPPVRPTGAPSAPAPAQLPEAAEKAVQTVAPVLAGDAAAGLEATGATGAAGADRLASFNLARLAVLWVSPTEWNRLKDDAQFLMSYRAAIRAAAHENLANFGHVLNLSLHQRVTLAEFTVDQVVKQWEFDHLPGSARREAQEALWAESRAKVAGLLTPAQLEGFGQMWYYGDAQQLVQRSRTMFTARGLAGLTREQLEWNLTSRGEGGFQRMAFRLDPETPGLTPPQRDLVLALRQSIESGRIVNQVTGAKVRDPEVSDLWPD